MELGALVWGLTQIVGTGTLTKVGENRLDAASPKVRELGGVLLNKLPESPTVRAIQAGQELNYDQLIIDIEPIEQDPEVIKLAAEIRSLIAQNQSLQAKLDIEIAKIRAQNIQIDRDQSSGNNVFSNKEEAKFVDHPDTATSLNNLALLHRSMGRYAAAEPLYLQSLAIREEQLGANHPDTATSLNNLALLYRSMGKYAAAEPLYVRSLAIREEQLGANHPDTANSLNNLALLYESMGRYPAAEPLYLRAVAILTQSLGTDHPKTQTCYQNLQLLRQQLTQQLEPPRMNWWQRLRGKLRSEQR